MAAALSPAAYSAVYGFNETESNYSEVASLYGLSDESASTCSSLSSSSDAYSTAAYSDSAVDQRPESPYTDQQSTSEGYKEGLESPADQLPSYAASSYASMQYRDYGVYSASAKYSYDEADSYYGVTAEGTPSPSKRDEEKAKIMLEASKKIDFFREFPWNEKFQLLLERPSLTPEEAKQRHDDIDSLAVEFIENAKVPVRTIVTELTLQNDKKEIPPIDVGGVAGGEKFVVENLFIKFAKDNIQIKLYDGDDWAQKAALHELKSLNALIACGIPNLHFPMMALLSCYGHYVVVVSKLPLNSDTLVYGSADASRTIKLNAEMEKLMKQVAQRLNLKGHEVKEGSTNQLRFIYGPVDIEGHKGLDGRFYVVDTARLFPPATPIKGVRSCHLYKLLRAELVRTNPKALSSDAFSFFGKPGSEIHNAEVIEATNRIFEVYIPQLTDEVITSSESVRDLMHKFGINMRFLGSLLTRALQNNFSSNSILKLLIELCARGSKALLFRQMRDAVHKFSKDSIDTECRRLAAQHLSLLAGSEEPSKRYWLEQLRPVIKERFIFCYSSGFRVSKEELDEAADATIGKVFHNTILAAGSSALSSLLLRSADIAGIKLSEAAMNKLQSSASVDSTDILELLMIAKRITVIPFVNNLKAAGKFAEAETFYQQELQNRIAALGAQSVQVALTRVHLAELFAEQKERFADAQREFMLAEEILDALATDTKIDVADIKEKRSDFLMKYDRFAEADALLRDVLKIKKSSLGDSHRELGPLYDKLARVATRQGKFEEAETFFKNSINIKKSAGADMENLARTLNGQAQLFFAQKQYERAKEIGKQVVEMFRSSKKGKTSSELGIALDNLGQLHAATGEHDVAASLFSEALVIKKESFGETHSHVAMTLDHQATNELTKLRKAGFSLTQNTISELQGKFEEAIGIFKKSLGDKNSAVGVCLNNLALLHLLANDVDRASVTLQESLRILQVSYGPQHPITQSTKLNLDKIVSSRNTDALDKMTPAYHAQHMNQNARMASEKKIVAEKLKELNPAEAKRILELLRQKKQRQHQQQQAPSAQQAPPPPPPAPSAAPSAAPVAPGTPSAAPVAPGAPSAAPVAPGAPSASYPALSQSQPVSAPTMSPALETARMVDNSDSFAIPMSLSSIRPPPKPINRSEPDIPEQPKSGLGESASQLPGITRRASSITLPTPQSSSASVEPVKKSGGIGSLISKLVSSFGGKTSKDSKKRKSKLPPTTAASQREESMPDVEAKQKRTDLRSEEERGAAKQKDEIDVSKERSKAPSKLLKSQKPAASMTEEKASSPSPKNALVRKEKEAAPILDLDDFSPAQKSDSSYGRPFSNSAMLLPAMGPSPVPASAIPRRDVPLSAPSHPKAPMIVPGGQASATPLQASPSRISSLSIQQTKSKKLSDKPPTESSMSRSRASVMKEESSPAFAPTLASNGESSPGEDEDLFILADKLEDEEDVVMAKSSDFDSPLEIATASSSSAPSADFYEMDADDELSLGTADPEDISSLLDELEEQGLGTDDLEALLASQVGEQPSEQFNFGLTDL